MFRLTLDLLQQCQRLGSFKFIHRTQCGFSDIKTRVSRINGCHPEGWKFMAIESKEGTCIVLIDKGEFSLEGIIVMNKSRTLFQGKIKQWPRSRNQEIRIKTRAKLE